MTFVLLVRQGRSALMCDAGSVVRAISENRTLSVSKPMSLKLWGMQTKECPHIFSVYWHNQIRKQVMKRFAARREPGFVSYNRERFHERPKLRCNLLRV